MHSNRLLPELFDIILIEFFPELLLHISIRLTHSPPSRSNSHVLA